MLASSALRSSHRLSFQSQHHPRPLLRPGLCAEEEDCQQAVSNLGGGAGARRPGNPLAAGPGDPPPGLETPSPSPIQAESSGEAALRRVGEGPGPAMRPLSTQLPPGKARGKQAKRNQPQNTSVPSLWASVSSSVTVPSNSEIPSVLTVGEAVQFLSSIPKAPCAFFPSLVPPLVLGKLRCLDGNVSAPLALPPAIPPNRVATAPVQVPAISELAASLLSNCFLQAGQDCTGLPEELPAGDVCTCLLSWRGL